VAYPNRNPEPLMEPEHTDTSSAGKPRVRKRMSTRSRIIFFVTAWLIVLMPFMFWWRTWFGRQLSDAELNQFLHDTDHPRHIQHALVQIGDRIAQHDASVQKYYPEMVSLAGFPADEIRNTDAWAMGQDNTVANFHQTLLKLLHDQSPTVRGNAALALVRFGDASGRPQIVALLQPATIVSPIAGRVSDITKTGTAVRQGGLIAKIEAAGQTKEVRSPLTGRVRSTNSQVGSQVPVGDELAIVDPGADQVWEALRALYLVGEPADLDAITPYQRQMPDMPDRISQQATLTSQAIRERAGHTK
jgi:hypothetical protein